MTTTTVNGTYGSLKTPCSIFVAENRHGLKYYACEGSQNVNQTYDEINEGCDVEELSDVDVFTWSSGIESEEELINAIEN